MSASLSNEEIENKYFLLGQREILSALNDLVHRHEGVTVYFNGGQHFILTILLAAQIDGLVFDLGGDERANLQLSKSTQCTFLAFPDGIRVQFTGLAPERFMWGDKEAFWVALPEKIVRMQRRDSYRSKLPLATTCKAKLIDLDGQMLGSWVIHDLSADGFAVVIDGAPPLKLGDQLSQVWISLVRNNHIHCAAIVRHITQIDKHRSGKFQIGFSFVNLPHVMGIAIQRTILNIEYERHKLQVK
ncbi:MAG: flagellar brake protein [Undibacterium sp.]|nr:flagellar brake protein [Undibacterium sp.]